MRKPPSVCYDVKAMGAWDFHETGVAVLAQVRANGCGKGVYSTPETFALDIAYKSQFLSARP